MKFEKTIVLISIISALTYDFQVRFLYDGIVYINDLLHPLLFIMFLSNGKIKRWELFGLVLITSYLLLNLFFNILSGIDSYLRDSQYIIRSLFSLFFLSIVLKRENDSGIDLRNYAIKIFKKTVFVLVIIGLVAFFLLTFGIDLFPYTSGRGWFNSRQLSSIFSEPALYGQMIIAYFFISYNSLYDLKKDIYRVLLIGLSLLFCQSAGAIFSFFLFLIYLSLKEKRFIKNIKYIGLMMSIIVISIYLTFTYLPNARILSLLQVQGSTSLALDRSGEIRVTNEFDSLKEFLKEDLVTVLFGLKNIDTNDFRIKRIDPLMGDMVGNGLVEITMRYGIVYILFLSILFLMILRKGNYFEFIIFFMLIVQIDGAIAKPWIWFYIAMFIISKKNENILNYQP